MTENEEKPSGQLPEEAPDAPPERAMMPPYVFSFLLLAFGAWCFWDGWLANKPDMEGYVVMMNRVASLILIPWAVWDYIKIGRQRNAGGDEPEN